MSAAFEDSRFKAAGTVGNFAGSDLAEDRQAVFA
jgi:hypothetical protein